MASLTPPASPLIIGNKKIEKIYGEQIKPAILFWNSIPLNIRIEPSRIFFDFRKRPNTSSRKSRRVMMADNRDSSAIVGNGDSVESIVIVKFGQSPSKEGGARMNSLIHRHRYYLKDAVPL